MGAPRVSDGEFIELVERLGPTEAAKKLNVDYRNITQRRQRIEQRTGRAIIYPKSERTRSIKPPQGNARIELNIPNGHVIIASDLHLWPGELTTSFRALLAFAKDLKPRALILNGDVMDLPKASRHAAIGWEKRPEIHEEIEWAQEALHPLEKMARNCELIWNLGNHDCLDIQTECLTRRGWLRWVDLTLEDEVLSKVGSAAVWSPIGDIVSYPFSGQLVRIEKTRCSMAVTGNHRVLLSRLNWRTRQYDIEEYRAAADLPFSFNLPMSAAVENVGAALSDDEISLAGWLVTDGGIQGNNYSIYQSKPDGIATIEGLLERLGISYTRHDRQREARIICGRIPRSEPLPSSQFYILAANSERIRGLLPDKRRLPDWAYNLTGRQFDVLLGALIAGDGVWDGSHIEDKQCAVLYGRHEILSDIQAVAVTHGWRARLAYDNRNDPRLCLSKIEKLRIEANDIFKESYTGLVWCLRVPHGNFMVRRNGCAYFTGNSRFESRIANLAPEYAKIHGVHLKDHFPAFQNAWSTVINENVLIKHRFRAGIHAVHNNLMWSGMNIVTGHLHSAQVRPLTYYNDRTIWGMDTGCVADTNARAFVEYTEDNPKSWRSGFGILTFIDGKMLMPELVLKWDGDHVQFRGEIVKV